MKKAFIFLSLIVGLALSGAGSAHAEGEAISLKVAPLSFDLGVNLGEEKAGKLYVENTSNKEVLINAEFSDFFVDDQGKYIFSEDKEIQNESLRPFLMKGWFSVDKNNFTLMPGASETVQFTIKVPEDASLGGHYAAIFFRTACPEQKMETSKLCVSGRIGSLFLIRVGGEAKRTGQIVKTALPIVTFDKTAKLEVTIRNTGNTHFKPDGVVEAKSLFGDQVFRMEIKDRPILPTVSRAFSGEIARKDFLGIYRVTGDIQDGEGNHLKFQRWIWLFPWREFLVIVFLLWLLLWTNRKYLEKRFARQ